MRTISCIGQAYGIRRLAGGSGRKKQRKEAKKNGEKKVKEKNRSERTDLKIRHYRS
jgi:hypothetical protein